MSTRRDFLKQLGLITAATVLPLRALTKESFLPEPRRSAVKAALRANDWQLVRSLMPAGARFLQRKESSYDDIWGLALRVERGGHMVKNSVGLSPPDIWTTEEADHITHVAVDCLVEWYDREGSRAIWQPESRV